MQPDLAPPQGGEQQRLLVEPQELMGRDGLRPGQPREGVVSDSAVPVTFSAHS